MKQRTGWGTAFGIALLLVALGAASPAMARDKEKGITKFDLSELADGETRTFGEGDHAIEATREGDVVVVTLPGRDGEPKILKCTVGKGSCYAYTTSGSGTKMVFLGDEDGDEASKFEVIVTGDHEAGDFSWISVGEGDEIGGEGLRIIGLDDGKLVLRCPEGDTTMKLNKDEAAGTYYCPQHNLALEETEAVKKFQKLLIKKKRISDE